MPFIESLNLAADEVLHALWHSTAVLAEQEAIPEVDAFSHLRQAVLNRVKAAKITHGIDYVPDGRAALWRVRLKIYRGLPGDRAELLGDTDDGKRLTETGATLLHGLPAVAAWTWDLIQTYHAGRTIEGLSPEALRHRLRTLRVALSKQGCDCVWRLPYTLAPVVAAPFDVASLRAAGVTNLWAAAGAARDAQDGQIYHAQVHVVQEAPAQRTPRESP